MWPLCFPQSGHYLTHLWKACRLELEKCLRELKEIPGVEGPPCTYAHLINETSVSRQVATVSGLFAGVLDLMATQA